MKVCDNDCRVCLFLFLSLLCSSRCSTTFAVVKLHDEQSEGLTRRLAIKLVREAKGNEITERQASNLWDNTVHRLGKEKGLLTGYVKPQEGTSKRTAAAKRNLQLDWSLTVLKLFDEVRRVALEVLKDAVLVEKLMPYLIYNLDEECLQALGKNRRVVGSKTNRKHNNQNGSSRSVPRRCTTTFFMLSLAAPPGLIFSHMFTPG